MRIIACLPVIALALSAQLSVAQTAVDEEAAISARGDANEEVTEDPHIPAKIDADGQAVAAGINQFGADLFRILPKQKSDLMISPASISLAFALAHAGAKGETRAQIARTLHYPVGLANFDRSAGQLMQSMQINAKGRTMAVNNAIWLQTELPVHADYLALVKQNYEAGLNRVDYAANPDAARETINGWVAGKTNDKIKNLLSADHVKKDTRSVLVNTIYFKSDWAEPFAKTATKIENFTHISGKSVKRPLMHQRGGFRFAEAGGVKAIALPYRGGETEMVVLLPKDRKGLAKLEKSLTGDALSEWAGRLKTSFAPDVILMLPKFKIEDKYELVDPLKALGMRIPFSDQSDFSGMKPVDLSSRNPLDWNMKISAVVHQTFVEVEEKGTEAAAATAIVQIMVTSARIGPPPKPKIFKADHPFLFAIRDVRTDAILFLGRYGGGKAK